MAALRRRQHVPWNAAGDASRRLDDSDDVVRDTGWVFNNEVGGHLTLADFVRSGEQEVGAYLHYFGVDADAARRSSFVEIGSGIGRMTAEFTKRFDHVTACDLDASFLRQCQRTVAEFGEPERLSTSHVSDGRSLNLPDASADVVFSYITLQHCNREDALALTREALRVVRPGGLIMLNYRTWIPLDSVLFPAGVWCERCGVCRFSVRRWPAVAGRPDWVGRPIAWRRRWCCSTCAPTTSDSSTRACGFGHPGRARPSLTWPYGRSMASTAVIGG